MKKEETTKTKSVTESLLAIQGKLKAPKGLRNTFGNFNYRNTEGILESVKPLLVEEGCTLKLSDEIVQIGDRYYIKATASLKKGTDVEEVTAFAREEENKKGMDAAMVTGATSSYARKYALNGLFLIDDTKDPDSDEYQKAQGRAPDKKTVKPEDKPWLNESDEAYGKVVDALKNKKATLAQVISKYKLSKEVREKLESIK